MEGVGGICVWGGGIKKDDRLVHHPQSTERSEPVLRWMGLQPVLRWMGGATACVKVDGWGHSLC